jgi:molybdopterin molybdotransferase
MANDSPRFTIFAPNISNQIAMIPFEEALSIIRGQIPGLPSERVNFSQSAGRVLAEPIIADIHMPPFNKSAMDGYACRKEDLPGPLKVIEEIPAGRMPEKPVGKGECSAIMTGAPMPVGANCVIMEEHTEQTEIGEIVFTHHATKSNICYLGQDVKQGDLLIPKGTLIRPEHIAIMASVGAIMVLVSIIPTIGVYSTGNELVEPNEQPVGSKIRNSNGYQIVAQLQQNGFRASYLGIIPDTPEDTAKAITTGFSSHDMLILTGGVSHGVYDFVPQVMQQCGIEILFHHLAVQPGKPALFGKRYDGRYFFGLPGNPVSSFVQTELLVKELCYILQGHQRDIPLIRMPLAVDYTRKRAERKSFVPVMLRNAEVHPVDYHGSAHIQALHGAHGIITVEPGVAEIKQGELVDVRLF